MIAEREDNMMKLYGSTTSPYVRRLRLLLHEKTLDFVVLNIMDPKDRKILSEISPVMKIPVMEIDGVTVWDSRQIFNYLTKQNIHRELSVKEENLLTAIDAINDSLVQLFLIERSSVTLGQENSYQKNNSERIELSVQFLEQEIQNRAFESWHYPSMALFSLIDWANFRNRYDFKKFPRLWSWYNENKQRSGVRETDPRSS
ncbi:MAG: hypothetical protein Fur0010_26050 [Bdellovibrio sp.]